MNYCILVVTFYHIADDETSRIQVLKRNSRAYKRINNVHLKSIKIQQYRSIYTDVF
jgi:hypothetical protein